MALLLKITAELAKNGMQYLDKFCREYPTFLHRIPQAQ